MLSGVFVFGQESPVEWTVEKLSESEDVVEVKFTADIDKDWVIYSQHTDDSGPVPTSFTFEVNEHIELLGDVEETTEVKKAYSELFEVDVMKMKGKAVFVQKIKKNKENTIFKGIINFMCCNNDRCLPPTDVDFSLEL